MEKRVNFPNVFVATSWRHPRCSSSLAILRLPGTLGGDLELLNKGQMMDRWSVYSKIIWSEDDSTYMKLFSWLFFGLNSLVSFRLEGFSVCCSPSGVASWHWKCWATGTKGPKMGKGFGGFGGTGGTNALEIGGWRLQPSGMYEKSYLVWFLSKL